MDRRKLLVAGGGFALGLCGTGIKAQIVNNDVPPEVLSRGAGKSLFGYGVLKRNWVAAGFGIPTYPFGLPNTEFKTSDGNRRVSEITGKIRLVALWAEWCPPCLAEQGELAALQRRHGDENFEILSVLTASSAKLSYKKAKQLLDARGAGDLPLWVEEKGGSEFARMMARPDSDGFAYPVGAFSLPTVLIVDETGNVRGRSIGSRGASRPVINRPPVPVSPSEAEGDVVVTSVTVSAYDYNEPPPASAWSGSDADVFIEMLKTQPFEALL